MPKAKAPGTALAQVRRVPLPRDYFADVRESSGLRMEKILCFTRKSQHEASAEPLARHHHHRYVLVFAWEGEGEVFVDERRFVLQPTQALLIFPFQLHHGFNFFQPRVLWQFVTFETKDAAALETLRLDPVRKLDSADLSLLTSLASAWNDSARSDELTDWLALVLKRILGKPSSFPKDQRPSSASSDSLLPRINVWCLRHLYESFGLKQLAAHLSISESHLRAKFREETGMSLGQHLRRLRLQKAVGLLMRSNLTATQVAERCGFDSIFTFSRAFRNFTGITCRDYRLGFKRKSRLKSRPGPDNRKS
jgi:AraC-like DNA-binding protein